MKYTFLVAMAAVSAASAYSQVNIPDGTRLRVRLDQTISSATAEEGQTVELSVTEPVKIDDVTVIPEGSRVTGTVTQSQEKRRMGRAGKLDFSIDRVRSVDGEWIPLRYTLTKKTGESHAVRTGVITAGVAAVFWPAAPVFLLMKGKETNINQGVIFYAYTDQNHMLAATVSGTQAGHPQSMAKPVVTASGPVVTAAAPGGNAAITITSTVNGADIEIDGSFVGSTPTTLQLSAGPHQVTVKSSSASWQRTVQVNAGSVINVNADLKNMPTTTAARR